MSIVLVGRAGHTPNLEAREKLLLIALADRANPEGLCYPGRESLAAYCCCTPRHVTRMIGRLAERGLIAVQNRRRGGNLYLVFPTEESRAEHGFTESGHGEPDIAVISGHADARNEDTPTPPTRAGLANGEPSGEPRDMSQRTGVVGVGTVVFGSKVTRAEHELATLVLADFNRMAGTRVTLDTREHLRLIVGRIREHPELELADFGRIIEANLADPWWDGRPSLNVIFSPKVFSIAMERGKEWAGSNGARPPKRGQQSLEDLVAMADRFDAEDAARDPQ